MSQFNKEELKKIAQTENANAEDKNTDAAAENVNAETKNAASAAESTSAADGVVKIEIPPEDEEVDNVVELSKKYEFEGKIIDKIDLTGLETVNGEMAQNIDKLYRKITKTPIASPEITPDYAMATASILTGLPVEFFKRISFKDITKMKNRIVNFLYGD